MSLKEAAADTVYNMGVDTSLDIIIKKFTKIRGSVKSFNLRVRDFCKVDQEEEHPFHHLPTGHGLLPTIRETFPWK